MSLGAKHGAHLKTPGGKEATMVRDPVHPPRRRLPPILAAVASVVLAAGAARAQTAADAWPTGPVRIIVPFVAGGAADSSIRVLTDGLAARLGQPVVIENRSGGAGAIGPGVVAAARPDGSTFLLDTSVHLVNAAVMTRLAFDYRTAFVPVTQVTRLLMVVATKSTLPMRTFVEFAAMARERPGAISCGSAGNTSAGRLIAELLAREGVRVLHVPFRGGADAARDLASGALDCAIITVPPVAPVVEGGRARLLAIGGAARSALLPGVPTIAESGFPDVDLGEWTGLWAPAGTSPVILDRMRGAVAAALRAPGMTERLAALGAEPVGSTTAEFTAFLDRAGPGMARLVRDARITAE